MATSKQERRGNMLFQVYATHKLTDRVHDLGEIDAESRREAERMGGQGYSSEDYQVWATTELAMPDAEDEDDTD
jgi:hypothetical protein